MESKWIETLRALVEEAFNIVDIPLCLVMNNKIFDYLLKCPRSRLVVSLTKFLASSHEWNYEYEIHSFLTEQELWPSFSRRKGLFVSSEEKLFFLMFSGERKKRISSPLFSGRERENVFFLSLVFHGESSHKEREFSLNREKKTFFF